MKTSFYLILWTEGGIVKNCMSVLISVCVTYESTALVLQGRWKALSANDVKSQHFHGGTAMITSCFFLCVFWGRKMEVADLIFCQKTNCQAPNFCQVLWWVSIIFTSSLQVKDDPLLEIRNLRLSEVTQLGSGQVRSEQGKLELVLLHARELCSLYWGYSNIHWSKHICWMLNMCTLETAANLTVIGSF